jgi:hypothetical protein
MVKQGMVGAKFLAISYRKFMPKAAFTAFGIPVLPQTSMRDCAADK